MKVAVSIEGRMASSRLPGKTMAPIMGRPMLALLIERMKLAKLVNEIIVATTDRPEDWVIQEMAEFMGVKCFRGSNDDLLDRVLKANQKYGSDLIVEVTADCPLLDPILVDMVVQKALETGYDYVANNLKLTYPRGLDVRAFPTKTLAEVASITNDPADREHVSLYIYEHPERYKVMNLESRLPPKWHGTRLTVDTSEDFKVVKAVFESLYPRNPAFGLDDILALLELRPELLNMNRHIQQRAAR
ncbi:MAG: spore coat biosynthesis protein F [Dehalococcoidia bacterium]|nr:spore coat biosynthesis protein F [Dehalococcoidia bacterium]